MWRNFVWMPSRIMAFFACLRWFFGSNPAGICTWQETVGDADFGQIASASGRFTYQCEVRSMSQEATLEGRVHSKPSRTPNLPEYGDSGGRPGHLLRANQSGKWSEIAQAINHFRYCFEISMSNRQYCSASRPSTIRVGVKDQLCGTV